MRTDYRDDGVVALPGALGSECMTLALEAYEWSLDNPGPGASNLPNQASGTFFQDLANPQAFEQYFDLVNHPDLVAILKELFVGKHAWFMYEQVFKKHSGSTRRTPWHQDTPYLPVGGNDLAVIWISFDNVDRDSTLEFVMKSHRGTLFDGSRFDPRDDTAPLYDHADYPRLPDIEANRNQYPIVGWPCSPGDVIVFHPSMLHGGGATTGTQLRRTLSLRYFGEDAVIAERPGAKVANRPKNLHPLHRVRQNPAGSPFRHADFPQTY